MDVRTGSRRARTQPRLASLRTETLAAGPGLAPPVRAGRPGGERGGRLPAADRAADPRPRRARAGSRFYRTYEDRAACYADAYETASERLAATLLAAGEGEDWIAAFRAALRELAAFLASEPLLARGLLAEVHVAGGAALAKRKEVFERLSRAVDAARRETPASRHSPPPITASFILCAIEEAVVRAALRGTPAEFSAALPDLTYLAATPYFGRERALAELQPPPRDTGRGQRGKGRPVRGCSRSRPLAPGGSPREWSRRGALGWREWPGSRSPPAGTAASQPQAQRV